MFFKALLLLIVISETCTAVAKCLRQKLDNPDETFLLSKSMQENLIDIILLAKNMKNDNLTDYIFDANATSQNHLPTHSICPWKLVKRFNPNRIPNTTIEAVCLNKQQCATDGKAQKKNPLEEMATPGCEPIKYFRWVQVLSGSGKNKKTKVNKKNKLKTKEKPKRYCYRLLPITVGCTLSCPTVKKLP